MRARPRSARARTEGDNRSSGHTVGVRGLRPRTFSAKRRNQFRVKASAFTRAEEFDCVVYDAEAEEAVAQLRVRLQQVLEILEGAGDLFVSSLEQRVDRAARLLTEHVRKLLHGVAGFLLFLRPLGRLLLRLAAAPRLEERPHEGNIGAGPKT